MQRFAHLFARAGMAVLLVSIFFIALGGVSHRERWRIQTIEIDGAQAVGRDRVMTLVQKELEGNYFFSYARNNSHLFPARDIEQAIKEAFPRVASVRSERTSDASIRVSVTERTPWALWCGEEPGDKRTCFFVDDTGFLFDEAPDFSDGVYTRMYGSLAKNNSTEISSRITQRNFNFMRGLMEELRRSTISLRAVAVKDGGEYEAVVHTSARYPVLAGVTLRIKDEAVPRALVKRFVLALDAQLAKKDASKKTFSYIDLRFGNKVFFGVGE